MDLAALEPCVYGRPLFGVAEEPHDRATRRRWSRADERHTRQRTPPRGGERRWAARPNDGPDKRGEPAVLLRPATLAAADVRSGGSTRGNGFQSVDQTQQVGSFGPAELAGLQRKKEEPLSFEFVRAEEQFDQTRLVELPLVAVFRSLAVEEHLVLRERLPGRSVGQPA